MNIINKSALVALIFVSSTLQLDAFPIPAWLKRNQKVATIGSAVVAAGCLAFFTAKALGYDSNWLHNKIHNQCQKELAKNVALVNYREIQLHDKPAMEAELDFNGAMLQESKNQLKKLDLKNQEFEIELKRIKQDVEDKDKKITALKEEKVHLENELDKVSVQLKEAKAQLEIAMPEQINSLHKVLETKNKHYSELQEKSERLEKQIEEINKQKLQELKDKNVQIAALQKQMVALQDESNQLILKLRTTEEDLNNVKAESAEIYQEKERLLKRTGELHDQLVKNNVDLTQIIEQLKVEKEIEAKRNEDLQKKLSEDRLYFEQKMRQAEQKKENALKEQERNARYVLEENKKENDDANKLYAEHLKQTNNILDIIENRITTITNHFTPALNTSTPSLDSSWQNLSTEEKLLSSEERIARGKRYLKALLEGNNDVIPTNNQQEHLNAIIDIIWYLYSLAEAKGQKFDEGTFRIEDKDFRILQFFMEYSKKVNPALQGYGKDTSSIATANPFAYCRGSTHFDDSRKKYGAYGIDMRFDVTQWEQTLLPAFKRHLLWGLIDEKSQYIYIKPENHGLYYWDGLPGHGSELFVAKLRKIPGAQTAFKLFGFNLGSDDQENFRKERIPAEFLTEFKAAVKQEKAFTAIDKKNLIDFANKEGLCVLSLSPLISQSEALKQLKAKYEKYDHLDVRSGREVIFKNIDLRTACNK